MKFSAPKAVLFDLDGTLVDTGADLLAALQAVREFNGIEAPAPVACAQFVSAGAVAMLRAGLPQALHPQMDRWRELFLNHYAQHICVHSTLYPGVADMLARLEAHNIAWGVVTNKPFYLAKPLLEALNLKPGALLGGDSLAVKKPDAAPLLAALNTLAVAPKDAWMVGDDPRDIAAGWNAGCAVTIACAYGYLGDSPPIETWGATWVAGKVEEMRL